MNRLLAREPRPGVKGRGAAIQFSGVQITEPVDVGPPGFGEAATDLRMRELVHATLHRVLTALT